MQHLPAANGFSSQGLASGTVTRSPDYRDMALGMVSTRSFPAIIGTADMMLKAAQVSLVGYEKIGSGYCTAVVRGSVSDVRLAVEAGAEAAEQFGQLIDKSVIARPMANLDAVLPIGSKLAEFLRVKGQSLLRRQAVGLLETRGFPAMVGAADAMLKSSEVYLAAYETIGDGLCTVIIRGNVTDVALAIEAGMAEAERIGELNAVMVIPRPMDDMEDVLPTAECWLEQPLALPLSIKESEKEVVEAATEEEAKEHLAQPLALPELKLASLEMPQPELADLEASKLEISELKQPRQQRLDEPTHDTPEPEQ